MFGTSAVHELLVDEVSQVIEYSEKAYTMTGGIIGTSKYFKINCHKLLKEPDGILKFSIIYIQ